LTASNLNDLGGLGSVLDLEGCPKSDSIPDARRFRSRLGVYEICRRIAG